MAIFIDDAGEHGFDALFIGVEDTAWSRSTTDECIWFSSTGTCETGFTLPDTEWIVYEVYGMTGVTADYTTLTGSTQLHGKKEYTTTIGTVLTTLNAWRTAYDTSKGSDYTTYEIIATHYKGSDLVDVYEADETTAFATATITDGFYTEHGSEWIVADALLADSVLGEIRLETNGEFTADTDWTKNTGITWSATNGGRYDFDIATNLFLIQTMTPSLSTGTRYAKEFQISEYVSGASYTLMSNQVDTTLYGYSANGIFTDYAYLTSAGQKTIAVYGSVATGLDASIEYVKVTEAYVSGDLSEVYVSNEAGISTFIDHKDGTFTVKVKAGTGTASPQITFNAAGAMDGLVVDFAFTCAVVSGDGDYYGYTTPDSSGGWNTSYAGGAVSLTNLVATTNKQAIIAFDCSSATVETEYLISGISIAEVTYGADIIDGGTPYVIDEDETTTFSTSDSNSFDLVVDSFGTAPDHPRVLTQTSILPKANTTYNFSFDIVVNAGECYLYRYYLATNNFPIHNQILTTGHYDYIIDTTDLGANQLAAFYFSSDEIGQEFDIEVTNWIAREIV